MGRCASRMQGKRCDLGEGHDGKHKVTKVTVWPTEAQDKRLSVIVSNGSKLVEECTHEELVEAMYLEAKRSRSF